MPRQPKRIENANDKGTIGHNLRVEISRSGKSQSWLADELGINRSLISKWCHNKVRPSSTNLRKIADALRTTVDNIIYGRNHNRQRLSAKAEIEKLEQQLEAMKNQIETIKNKL